MATAESSDVRSGVRCSASQVHDFLTEACFEFPDLSKQVDFIEVQQGVQVVVHAQSEQGAAKIRALLTALGKVEVVTDAPAGSSVASDARNPQKLFPFMTNGNGNGKGTVL
ncbi:MAG: hypothetical protein PHE68_05830 [Candidatus Peribacteraceae bacterium]|nr:hypothetical protein [Candidatus Peribacteraceae bacterium]MDD5075407.1 hypothetical protein [Candidatus Peribacteraceae bacterium]